MIRKNVWYTGIATEWDGKLEYAYFLFDGQQSKIMYTTEEEYFESDGYDTKYIKECSAIIHTVTRDYVLSVIGDTDVLRYASLPTLGRKVRYSNS